MTGHRAEPTSVRSIVLYGTLRRGSEKYAQLGLEGRLTYVGECTVEGVLYDLGDYPGLVLEPGTADGAESGAADGQTDPNCVDPILVTGELYRVEDETVFRDLDAFERYDPTDRDGSLYVRQLVRLEEPPVDAWTYVYNRDVGDAPVIESGDWRADDDGE